MSKHIWIINQFAGNPESGWGERHYYLSKKWIKDGYKVSIVSSSNNHMFTETTNSKKQYNFEKYNDTNFCWIKTPSYNPKSIMRFIVMLIFTFKLIFLPKKKIGSPDIIIVSSMPIFPILSGYILKKVYKAEKLIFEIRDLWPLTLIELKGISSWHPLVVFIGWFEKFGYKRADHIVSLLPKASKYIKSIAPKAEKIHYIPNGIFVKNAQKNTKVPVSYFTEISKNDFVVGYTGTIGMANALVPLLDAALTLPTNIKLVLVGDGYLKKQYVKKYKKCTNIIFLPRVPKQAVRSVIDRFNICIINIPDIPLYHYGVSPNKFFDYMYSGKPILSACNIPLNPVELSNCGLIVKPESPDAIKKGILQLYDMTSEERSEMGLRGKEYVLKYHTYEFLSTKYEELF